MSDEEIKTDVTPTLSKAEIIRQVAQTLKERRMARSLTLEKVTQSIKIRIPYLQSIESGDWDQLPGEVYVRGFIRRYAQSLGLDGDKLLAPYVAAVEMPVEKKSAPSPIKVKEFSPMQILWGFLGVLFIIGLLKVIKQDHAVPVKPVVPAAATPTKSDAPATVRPPVVAKVDEPKAVLVKHEMVVFSPYPLWLRVTASEKVFEGFIPQSSTWTWKGEGEFTIRLGHTKLVSLSFDGQPVTITEDQKKIVLPAS